MGYLIVRGQPKRKRVKTTNMGRDAVFKVASAFFIRHIAPYLRGCVFKREKGTTYSMFVL